MQDVVIIGSGPAGLSAALYMLRGGFSTTVIGKDNGALEKAEKIENYFGLERPLSGHELIENGRTQVQRLGGTLLQDEDIKEQLEKSEKKSNQTDNSNSEMSLPSLDSVAKKNGLNDDHVEEEDIWNF